MKNTTKKIVYVRVKEQNHAFLVKESKQNKMTRSKWLDSMLDKIRMSNYGTKRGNQIPKAS